MQFYLNNVTNLHQLTTHGTTSCRTISRLYRDHRLLWCHFNLCIPHVSSIMLAASSRKHIAMVWYLFVCLFICLSYLPEGSIRRGQRAFQPDSKEVQHSCYDYVALISFVNIKYGDIAIECIQWGTAVIRFLWSKGLYKCCSLWRVFSV